MNNNENLIPERKFIYFGEKFKEPIKISLITEKENIERIENLIEERKILKIKEFLEIIINESEKVIKEIAEIITI